MELGPGQALTPMCGPPKAHRHPATRAPTSPLPQGPPDPQGRSTPNPQPGSFPEESIYTELKKVQSPQSKHLPRDETH